MGTVTTRAIFTIGISVLAGSLLTGAAFVSLRKWNEHKTAVASQSNQQKSFAESESNSQKRAAVDGQQKSAAENEWKVKSRYNGVRGTSTTMITRRAEGYAEYMTQAPKFLMFCSDDSSPYVVIDTGQPLWERTNNYYITYRFEGDTPVEELWNAKENTALYPDDAFAKMAIASSGLWLELPYGQQSKRPVHFDLTGLAQVSRKNCSRGAEQQ